MDQKSLERVVSQKALQIGTSFPCKICVMGFLCGVCLASLFLAALTSFATFQPFSSTFSNGFSTMDSGKNFWVLKNHPVSFSYYLYRRIISL